MLFKVPMNIRGVLRTLGIVMHIPSIMALLSIPVSFYFHEYYAITPFFITAFVGVIIGQVLWLSFRKKTALSLRDGMVSAALCWFLCPFIATIPLYWIANKLLLLGNTASALSILAEPINSFFEAFSGFSTTGLSMVSTPSELPHCLQWWRSLMEWVGSLGFMVFVMALIEPKSEDFQLFYSEVYEKKFEKNIYQTARAIWLIYVAYTIVCVLLFKIAGMPLWEAINHGMCGVSTGGFAMTDDSFESYSTLIKWVALFVMSLGATSFVVHYKVIHKKKFKELWHNFQNRVFWFILLFGSILLYFLNRSNLSWTDSLFQWFSSATTTGYNSVTTGNLTSMIKLFLVTAMAMGACSGSTGGGLKIRRIIHIWRGIIIRIATVLKSKAGEREYMSHSIALPKEMKLTEKLYEATILFALYIFTLFIAFFLLNYLSPDSDSVNILFDSVSAFSNVGLSTGFISAQLPTLSKVIVIFTMVMGRLEIIPILVLFLSWFLSPRSIRKKSESRGVGNCIRNDDFAGRAKFLKNYCSLNKKFTNIHFFI